MSRGFQRFLPAAFVCVAFALAAAQQPSSGLYESTSISFAHDDSSGWQSLLSPALGYDFSRNFSVESGVPLYVVTTTNSTSASGTTTTNTVSNVLGDAFVRVHASKSGEAFKYAATLTGTAPTGDTNAGVSTGRATVTFDNRLERGFDHFTPFVDGSFGNTLNSSKRYQRSYTTLGAVSEFRGGVGFDLLKNLDFEASYYGDVGYGNQKVYSKQVGKGAAGKAGSSHGRPFETAYLTTGDASLVNDHGFTADLSFSPVQRYSMDFAYNRSVPFALNSVEVTVGVKLGHLNSSGKSN